MRILVIHPTSNQFNRNLLIALQEKGYLCKFITIASFNTDKIIFKLLPKKLVNFLERRNFSKITSKIYTPSIISQIIYFIKSRFDKNFSTTKGYHYIDKIAANYLKKNVKDIDAVYSYEDAALETFKIAKKNNIKCIYELPIGYWKEKNKILASKNEKYFQNLNNIHTKHSYVEGYKKNLELKLADQIIVPSKFVKDTLKESNINYKKVKIIPYGFNRALNRINWSIKKSKRLKILFVGGLIPRKGLNYLLDAVKKINNTKKIVDLTIVGSGPLENFVKNKQNQLKYIKSLPHNEILKLMRKNDIFVLPTLYEGFGLVLTEAMSNGMVVMSTNCTCLPEITNGDDCIIIKTENIKGIIDQITKLNNNRMMIKKIGLNAIKTSKNYSWVDYQKKIIQVLGNE
jgi:glycosyltransferase involved in cell wall biosynthesis